MTCTGWIIIVKYGWQAIALPAGAAMMDGLTEAQLAGLPSLCGVWKTKDEADKATRGLPPEFCEHAEVVQVTITTGE